jgi:hypothetical protein
MPLPLAHIGPWLEPLMFAPAFAIVLWAMFSSRRRRDDRDA